MTTANKPTAAVPTTQRRLRRLPVGDPSFWLLLVACLIYSTLFAWTLPPLMSDEVVFGRASESILRGNLLVFSAMTYCGALKSYLDAPLVLLFGPQDWTLRFWPVVFHLLQTALVYLILRKLLARRFAFVGALLMTAWGYPVMRLLHLGLAYSLAFTLWVSLIYAVTLILFEEERLARWFWLLGALSGLSLWMMPQSLLLILPTAATAFLSLKGQKGFAGLAGRWSLGCLLSALPWWRYNIIQSWMGTFRENAVASFPQLTLKARVAAAFSNCYYFLAEKLQDTLARPALWFPVSDFGSYLRPIAPILAIVVLILTAWFAASTLKNYGPPILRRLLPGGATGRFTASERAGLFWIGTVLGIIGAWLSAIGLSAAGSGRGAIERYTLPYVCVIPLLLPYCCSRLQQARLQRFLLFFTATLLCLPAALDTANLPSRLHNRDVARKEQEAIERLIASSGARFVAGDYWDVDRFGFRFPQDLAVIHLTEDLKRNIQTEEYLPPRKHPSEGDYGLLVFRRGTPLESAALKHGYGCLQELPAPRAYRVALMPDRAATCPAVELFRAMLEAERKFDDFRRGLIDRLVVNDWLKTMESGGQGDSGRGYLIDRPGDYAVFGPYISLVAGRYRVKFVFADVDATFSSRSRDKFAGASCRVVADVVTHLGQKTYWKREIDVSPGSVIEGEFDAPASGPGGPYFETRLWARWVSRPLRLALVSLERVNPGATRKATGG